MKHKYLFIFLTLLSAVFACERIDESALGEKETVEKVPMTFTAVIESEDQTKTVLGEEVTTDGVTVKKLLWQPDDAIGVSPEVTVAGMYIWTDVTEFTSTLSENSAVSEFDGSTAFASRYKAFYPYTETLRDSNNVFVFNMPATQKYVNGSFDPEAAPMVAFANAGEDFEFKNVCGIVAFNLKGTDAVKTITFSGADANGIKIPVSGTFDVDPAAEDPTIRQHSPFGYVGYSLTLDCVEPVQLDEAEATSFYMMLPPATYANFTLLITTSEGEIMLKSGKNLTITRSHLKPTSELEYVESVYVDLSAEGTANSYIVPQAGLYSFKADVVGNGIYGYVENESFYPGVPEISPKKVKLLWEDKTDIISYLALKDGRVQFMANGQEGNAFIAVTDDNGNILWSWHLWMTDRPQEQTYVNDKGTFYVLDRNVGAISATRGTTDQDWYDSMGLLYQWGRKDPFRNNVTPSNVQTQLYLEEVVLYADYFIAGNWTWVKEADRSDYLWSATQKTIYDPCPPGYRVPAKDIWYGFTVDGEQADRRIKINASGSYDKGWNFYLDESESVTAWYPATSNLGYWGGLSIESSRGYMWSAELPWSQGGYSYNLSYYYNTDLECHVYNISNNADHVNAFPVRCMKDSGYETTKMAQVEFTGTSDVTTSSVTLNGKVTTEGWTSISDKGFIWGTTSDLSDGQTVSCGAGSEDFSHILANLTAAGVYYVKAYATNSAGTSYSDVVRFTTRYSDEVENLSASGNANCYMVKPVAGTYSFDARVKGNSTETLSPVSAELVWEVDGNRDVCTNIVDNVRLSDGWVLFEVPADVEPGNALIAVKDANGTILWSWHIWVVDYDPVTTQHLFNNGAVFMDRNLGAVTNAPDYNDLESTWASAYGMIYQWGRKDPLIKTLMTSDLNRAFTSVDEASANPTTFAANIPWISPFISDLWLPEKTMYDPCPAGWKVPSYEEINGLWYSGDYNSYGLTVCVNNTQESWLGFGDYIHSDGTYYSNGGQGYYWNTTYLSQFNSVRALSVYNGIGSSDMSPTDAYPVRCMKDE